MHSLHAIIDEYKRGDELLESLASPLTTSDQRAAIIQQLEEQRLRVATNRAEAARLHAQSQTVLEHSARLLAKIERRMYERTHKASSYAPEICGWCRGVGGGDNAPCVACNGKRTVLVHQPPVKCPRCLGSGKPIYQDRIQFSLSLCLVCRGNGWALSINE